MTKSFRQCGYLVYFNLHRHVRLSWGHVLHDILTPIPPFHPFQRIWTLGSEQKVENRVVLLKRSRKGIVCWELNVLYLYIAFQCPVPLHCLSMFCTFTLPFNVHTFPAGGAGEALICVVVTHTGNSDPGQSMNPPHTNGFSDYKTKSGMRKQTFIENLRSDRVNWKHRIYAN